jgi:hypothetical protein
MTTHDEPALIETRLVECERQCRALLGENELLRGLLGEAVGLLLGDLPCADAGTFLDKLQRFL